MVLRSNYICPLLLLLHRYLQDIPLKNELRLIGKEAMTDISLIII